MGKQRQLCYEKYTKLFLCLFFFLYLFVYNKEQSQGKTPLSSDSIFLGNAEKTLGWDSWTEGTGERKGGRMSLRALCSLDTENPGTWFLLLFLPLISLIWGFGQQIPHWLASPAQGLVIKAKERCSESYWTLLALSVKDQTIERNLWAGHLCRVTFLFLRGIFVMCLQNKAEKYESSKYLTSSSCSAQESVILHYVSLLTEV